MTRKIVRISDTVSLGLLEELMLASLPDHPIPYDEAVMVVGLTADQARHALLRLASTGRARAWTEYRSMTLVAKGPFRQCAACGKVCAPGCCAPPNYRYSPGAGLLAIGSEGPEGCGYDPAESEAA